jgi:predicted nucleic acid-binding protein
VISNRRLPGSGLALEPAVQIVEEWLELPNVRILVPGDRHWSVLRRMIVEGQASGPLIGDAQLAALTIEYGAVLYTADQDFARFPGLRWVNPLS